MALGDAEVLLNALESQPSLRRYVDEITRSVHDRRSVAVEIAFAQGKLDQVESISNMLDFNGLEWSRKVKIRLARLPEPLRTLAWRITAWGGTLRGRMAAARADRPGG